MKEKIYSCQNLESLKKVAEEILADFPHSRVWAFFGRMGAGKTTFIKELCHSLGVIDTVCSPTFSIVNEYFTKSKQSIYHFDFYRLKNITEAYDIGYEEYFYSENYCLIEWSEKVEELLPDDCLKLYISGGEDGNEDRQIRILFD